MFESLKLPPYSSLKHLEGKGNYAIKKYYQFPYRFFYRKKLKMIVSLMKDEPIYRNILDFGSGPGIFTEELKRHALFVNNFDENNIIDFRWNYDAIVCASTLEFVPSLKNSILSLKSILNEGGKLFVASPIDSMESRLYFRLIKNKQNRHPHQKILSEISKHFRLEVYKEWFNLYFALRASKS